jgi:hypothetical protein
MKSRHFVKTIGACMAALAASGAVIQTPAALAEQTAPAQTTPAQTASASADPRAQWAAANCVDQRVSNTAAGAVAGGALGAIAGAALTGRGVGALAGGAVGAVTGAAVGSTAPTSCPPGYVVRAGAPYPYYPAVVYGPGWVWAGDHWVYPPYAPPYWGPVYWRGGWVGRPWVVYHRP